MTLRERFRRLIMGSPKDPREPGAFHRLSLIALLAWVGLGADGLSSSSYGPDESFRALGTHTGIAVFLALATAITVVVIAYGYSRIIEQFPSGGGGFVVASKILGPRVGVVSGSALLVDYVLTIAMSIAAGADAIFSFLPQAWLSYKLGFAFLGIAVLTVMNLRGVKESVITISPIFILFLVTHAILLVVVIGGHLPELPRVAGEVRASLGDTTRELGIFGALAVFMRAYSMGAGTYTGIEAVSNGLQVMREPRVETAKRTMVLMSISLAVTAGGIMLSYLLLHASPMTGKTMNAVLLERGFGSWAPGGIGLGPAFVVATLVSEGALLFVAAQTGFIDGPRVMANMATDSWLPHRFAALSERLTMRNGILLMGGAAIAILLYTRGDISKLVVLYAINVFITFSLSNIAMTVFWVRHRKTDPKWAHHLPAHVAAALLCMFILTVTIAEKLTEGAWLTLLVTTGLVVLCYLVKRHYGQVVRAIRRLDTELPGPEAGPEARSLYGDLPARPAEGEPDPDKPVAVVFVGAYSGLGRSAIRTLLRMFPGHFEGVVFVSIALVDSDTFKGVKEIEALENRTRESLASYERFAHTLGLRAASRNAMGTEVAVEAENMSKALLEIYPKALVVAGQIIFEEDTTWNRLLHNETAFAIQRRLQHAGVPMVVLPVQIDLRG